tara:strand:- start:534 stop:737 length:204 start_codon:yes stop_codon:yes gene_type:complete
MSDKSDIDSIFNTVRQVGISSRGFGAGVIVDAWLKRQITNRYNTNKVRVKSNSDIFKDLDKILRENK